MILSANVDCEICDTAYVGQWHDESDTVQDMDEAPEQDQICPECGHVQLEVWPGWVNHTEAG